MDEEIKIDKGIPIPRDSKGRPKINLNLLRAMKVGDSVLVDTKKAKSLYSASSVAGVKLSMRRVEGGTRVWRIK